MLSLDYKLNIFVCTKGLDQTRYLQHQPHLSNLIITGDDSSLTDTKISELLDFDPAQLKAAIPRLHVTIKEYINFDSLNPFLDKYEVFTRDEMKYFTSKYHSDSDKVSNLIEWLHKKGGRGIHNFVRALKGAEEHSGHFEIIKDLHICTVGTTV